MIKAFCDICGAECSKDEYYYRSTYAVVGPNRSRRTFGGSAGIEIHMCSLCKSTANNLGADLSHEIRDIFLSVLRKKIQTKKK